MSPRAQDDMRAMNLNSTKFGIDFVLRRSDTGIRMVDERGKKVVACAMWKGMEGSVGKLTSKDDEIVVRLVFNVVWQSMSDRF